MHFLGRAHPAKKYTRQVHAQIGPSPKAHFKLFKPNSQQRVGPIGRQRVGRAAEGGAAETAPRDVRAEHAAMRGKKSVKWSTPLACSSVESHPDLLSVPTFVLFVQKDELAMSRAEVRKEDRLMARDEFESWLSNQTAPRAPAPKKQMQNEESLAPVDDKERTAVAVRTQAQTNKMGGPGAKITRPSSDGFRPRAGGVRPLAPANAASRAWNSQRGARPPNAVDAPSPPRSRATTMADTLDPANRAGTDPSGALSGNSPGPRNTRKSPTPRGTPRNGAGGRSSGKSPTPRAGKSPTPRPRSIGGGPAAQGGQNRPPPTPPARGQTPPRRPPSARKPSPGNRPSARAQSPAVGSARARQQRVDPAAS